MPLAVNQPVPLLGMAETAGAFPAPAIVKVEFGGLSVVTIMTLPVKNRPPVIVPPAALRRAGFRSGQELEVKASGGVITILPRLPSADNEYTAAQRLAIDAELADAEKGPFYGPFESMDQMVEHLQGRLKKRRSAKRAKSLR